MPATIPSALPAVVAVLAVAAPLAAQQPTYPREVAVQGGKLVFYQPQPDSIRGNRIHARVVASWTKGGSAPVFGTAWITAAVDSDKDAGTATVRDFRVERLRWPDATEAKADSATTIMQGVLAGLELPISMERLSASLEAAESERRSVANLKHDPPKIVFREQLAVLLLYDGEPRLKRMDDSPWERALNTPYLVVKDTRDGRFWLSNGSTWYGSAAATGPWQAGAKPPAELVAAVPKDTTAGPPPRVPPVIVVATEPTELVVTEGAPAWKSLGAGDLMFVENTETPWVREVASGDLFMLLSGRWFRAKTTAGPWTFVRPDQLPAAFGKIPPASDLGGIRTSVAGTPEAEDAMADAQVPQTAAIERKDAKLTVEYDGEPKFEPVTGTEVEYAVNTGSQVLRIGGKYYAVDNGVWFTAAAPRGPWAVADSVPDGEIGKIPPSSPVHNVTYVHVYDATPEVVYVGYYPGYVYSYPYYGVPVYGTGWYYPPWYGGWYYPRPPTWGFHVGYNPWTGWSYGVSWSAGFMTIGVAFGGWGPAYRPCCGGWYGGGYRPPVYINNGDINIGNSVGGRPGTKPGSRPSTRPAGDNLYQRPENRARTADPATVARSGPETRAVQNSRNNVLADQNGNVVRRNPDGSYNQRDGGQWKPEGAATREARPADRAASPSTGGFDRTSVERDYQARVRGSTREAQRPQSRPAGRSMPRGGGGRRR